MTRVTVDFKLKRVDGQSGTFLEKKTTGSCILPNIAIVFSKYFFKITDADHFS